MPIASELDVPLHRHRRFWPLALLAFTAVGALRFAYLYLDDLTRGTRGTLVQRLLEEGTGAYTALLLVPFVGWLAWRVTPRRVGWPRAVAVHLAAAVAYSAAHTTLLWLSRSALFPMAGVGTFDYGDLVWRYPMELANDLISYGMFLTAVALYRWHRELRARERHAAELQRSLARAELQALRLQLQPHFLFNALNTVSSVMYEDPAAADAMVGELAELLRFSLHTSRTQEVPLATEVAVLERYVGLMRARFGDALRVELDVPPELAGAMVPSLLLQPLVENAARHGNLARLGSGHVVVRAARDADRLRLTVWDDGPGPEAGSEPLGLGLGLSATAERLRLLHGDDGRLRFAADADGFAVHVTVPLRLGAVPAAPLMPDLPESAHAHPAR
jgi:signal transduction histidine kinase